MRLRRMGVQTSASAGARKRSVPAQSVNRLIVSGDFQLLQSLRKDVRLFSGVRVSRRNI